MWPETKIKTELEIALLERLLRDNRVLLEKAEQAEPDSTELLALSALLHSFYTGVENVFKRIALEIDGAMPSGNRSHSELLLQMCQASPSRPAVVSDDLKLRLGEYMDFRHVFRHAYSFDLRWRKMAGLVLGVRDTLDQVESALSEFFVKKRP